MQTAIKNKQRCMILATLFLYVKVSLQSLLPAGSKCLRSFWLCLETVLRLQ